MTDLLGPGLDMAKLLIDPAFNEALSPAQGLEVTPHVFASLEQEGRWKYQMWGFPEERNLTNSLTGDEPMPDAMSRPTPSPPSIGTLLTLQINKLTVPDEILLGIGATLAVPLAGSALTPLIKASAAGDVNSATISVMWWSDGLEIWGGVAGLVQAKGFGSVFGHRARIDVTGTAFGNYFPARYLIMASGWLNPLGPQYYEFRCGAIAQAGYTRLTPLFGEVWDRDGRRVALQPSVSDGYSFTVRRWVLPSSQIG
jgi:hypothetical protein